MVLGTLDTPFGRSQEARYGDGWLPLPFDVDKTKRSIAEVHAQMRSGANRASLRLPVAEESAVLKVVMSED